MADSDSGGTMRDTARTRRLVLDAAARTVAAQGAGVSLDVIARDAGVSKSGLLHHFRSRDQLLRELAEDQMQQFRTAVDAAVDPRDHAAGRLVRGYVNAVFDELKDGSVAPEHIRLVAALSTVPGVDEVMRADTRHWTEQFEADGLHPDRVLLITQAADGASLAAIYEGEPNPAKRQRTRELLLRLSHGEGAP
ncbi:TetR/AcrR family transcriptional regulator [Paractinoplanes abujensis]|uniref:AcrR family transcriptional regulator n=1 Tax=Paractinoplanes abujensis TaxID=882441 RepID=A0A7W7CS88_9ACTN|nr:TetR/AcrR family transcriptional regulator [Actinoplanes abujensis]MBB4693749.1 AcrR family transcriptional regulator [Actinoplanes abujensis]